jgi:hypothetical protein
MVKGFFVAHDLKNLSSLFKGTDRKRKRPRVDARTCIMREYEPVSHRYDLAPEGLQNQHAALTPDNDGMSL